MIFKIQKEVISIIFFFKSLSKAKINGSKSNSHYRYVIPEQGVESPGLGLFKQLSMLNIPEIKTDFNWLHIDMDFNNATGKLFINCATLSPDMHIKLEQAAARVGAETLEGCMASSITQAREGTLYLMIGGKRETFESVKDLLEDLSVNLRFVGEAGKAAQVKALVNMVMNINTAALAEGLGIGDALGLDLEMLCEIFSQTGANSRVLETDSEDMLGRDHECYFSAEHAAKDSGIAIAVAEGAGISVPLAKATLAQYQKMVDLGLGDLDKSGIAELTFKGRGTGN